MSPVSVSVLHIELVYHIWNLCATVFGQKMRRFGFNKIHLAVNAAEKGKIRFQRVHIGKRRIVRPHKHCIYS